MTIVQIIVIALIQGITEFLPISSSGHLVLVPSLTGWRDQGLVIDVAVHVGTLLAVLLYFWRDVGQLAAGLLQLVTGKRGPQADLTLMIIVATIPVVIAGVALHAVYPGWLRSIEVVAWATLVFGILLYVVDRVSLTVRRIEHMGLGGAVFIGLAQVLALIPGTSRAGITMTAGRALGLEREEAARFSLLLSIPTIAAAGIVTGIDLAEMDQPALTREAALACFLAFVSALIAIAGMMAWLRRASFTPFVIYRVILGTGLLYWYYVLA